MNENNFQKSEKLNDFFKQNNWTISKALGWLIIISLLYPAGSLTKYIQAHLTIPALTHIQSAMPRDHLLLMIAGLSLFTIILFVILIFLLLNNLNLKKQLIFINKKHPHLFGFNIYWDAYHNPYCPADFTLMHPYPYEQGGLATQLQCYKCKQIIPIIQNASGISLSLLSAKSELIKNKYK